MWCRLTTQSKILPMMKWIYSQSQQIKQLIRLAIIWVWFFILQWAYTHAWSASNGISTRLRLRLYRDSYCAKFAILHLSISKSFSCATHLLTQISRHSYEWPNVSLQTFVICLNFDWRAWNGTTHRKQSRSYLGKFGVDRCRPRNK